MLVDNDKFKGLDGKQISKSVNVCFPIQYTAVDDMLPTKYLDSSKNKDIEFDSEKIKTFVNSSDYIEDLKLIANEVNKEDALVKINHSDFKISYKELEPIDLIYNIENNNINIHTTNLKSEDKINFFIERNIEDLFINSLSQKLSYDQKHNFLQLDDIATNKQFIELDQYAKYIEKIDELNKILDKQETLYIQDQKLFRIWKEEYLVNLLNSTKKHKMNLLVSTLETTLYVYAINLINSKHPNSDKIIDLLDDKTPVFNFLSKEIKFLLDSNYANLKKYYLNNIFIDNKLPKDYINICLNNNNINVSDFEDLVKNNIKVFRDNINSINIYDSTDKLVKNKIMDLFPIININPLECQIKNFFVDSLKTNSKQLDNIYESLSRIDLDNDSNKQQLVQKKIEFRNIENELRKYHTFYINLFRDKLDKVDELFNRNEEMLVEKYNNLSKEYMQRFESFCNELSCDNKTKDKFKKIEDVINSDSLKKEFLELRQLRNMFSHEEKTPETPAILNLITKIRNGITKLNNKEFKENILKNFKNKD